ncbi:hypothetical protein SDC9_199073 [bioreactor metagenome]|uniref:Uncharacterized protein n=1 Tax=bioreactor metagenome TaxID=1076179 RepID=A0A645IJG3_9ZZZZ
MSVLHTEGFHAFKDRLTIVHAVGGNGHRNVVVVMNTQLTPLSVGIGGPDIGLGRPELEPEFVPLDIHKVAPPLQVMRK